MVTKVTLNEQPTKLKIVIETKFKEKIWIQVRDANRKNTYYTKRYGFVDGTEEFVVLMPQAPREAVIIVFNDNNGLIRNDSSFNVKEIKALPYKLPRYNFSKKTQSFVKFAQEFVIFDQYLLTIRQH